MNLSVKPQKITTEELQVAFNASNLKYRGWGFLRALQTPSVCKSLELDAFARRKKAEAETA
jgi:hypothetical protein